MPRPLTKNLNFCFTKIKPSPNSNHLVRPLFSSNPFLKTFNSLYDFTFDRTSTSTKSSTTTPTSASSDSDSGDVPISSSTPDLTTVFASQRFFFSSPGRSNSIIDSSSSSISSSVASSSSSPVAVTTEPENIVGSSSVAVPTYSPDPYMDFRRSMQEMVEARSEMIDWDFLQDLLMCFLSLNPKSTHKFILGAFADLLVNLMTPSPVNECGGV